MLRSLLVPLDGSSMAEQATIAAGEIARRHRARLILASVHPWGPEEDMPRPGSAADCEMRLTEKAYLDSLRGRVGRAFGIEVLAELLEGSVAPALAALAKREAVDLIVSSTHGHGRLWRAVRKVGIIELVHRVSCPTLLLKPEQASEAVVPPDGFRRIAVALDGESLPEPMIRSALELAASAEKPLLSLVRVVSPKVFGNRSFAERWQEALHYLSGLSWSLRGCGLRVRSRVLTSSNPAAAILEEITRSRSELLVMAPRHRGWKGIILLPSVTNAIVHGVCPAVLVCHARPEAAHQRARVPSPARNVEVISQLGAATV